MESKKILKIVSIILIIVVVSICFGVAIFSSQDIEVRIERAGVCNPLKPVKDKEVQTDEDTKKQLAKYWKKTDKEVAPKDKEVVASLVGKNEKDIIDTYYEIALDTQKEVEKYERVPEMVEAFVENYCQLDDEDPNDIEE